MDPQFASRRKFLKQVGAGASLAAFGTLLAGCASNNGQAAGTQSPSPGSTGTTNPDGSEALGNGLLVSPPVTDNIYWDGWIAAAEAAAVALGISTKIENFNGDTEAQVASFGNAKNLDLTGVMTMANSAGASPRLFDILQREGIYGYNSHNNQPWNTPLDIGEFYAGYLEFPNDLGMQALCESLFEVMGGAGKVIHIEGVPGNLASEYRTIGVNNALAKYPDIEVVDRQFGQFSRVETAPVVENILTAHPDVEAVICQNDDSALGAVAALKRAGVEAHVVGVDAVPEMLDAIEAGDALATIANSGPWLGGAMTVRLFDAVNGVTLSPLERMQQFEAFVVNTPESAAAFNEMNYQGDAPYDWEKMSRFLHPDDWDMQIGMRAIRPASYWEPFEDQRPDGYELPQEYLDATEADYEELDATYASHLKSNPFDEIKALTDPQYSVP